MKLYKEWVSKIFSKIEFVLKIILEKVKFWIITLL